MSEARPGESRSLSLALSFLNNFCFLSNLPKIAFDSFRSSESSGAASMPADVCAFPQRVLVVAFCVRERERERFLGKCASCESSSKCEALWCIETFARIKLNFGLKWTSSTDCSLEDLELPSGLVQLESGSSNEPKKLLLNKFLTEQFF